ncbi:MAG: putative toxin-antitoxin system toxin component, PIN family [Verrucomicrobia bacterium]|nr:MAG: putative toxin-antitoxin system toxin component, PIN family [Verrucomicrobiota bacterium]
MRILFDTNVLFAAFTTRGFCEELVEETIDLYTIIWSPPLRAEFISALRRKRFVTPTVLEAIAAFSDVCEMCDPLKLPKRVCRDPDGDVVLGTALAGRADLVVTGDHDLLVLKNFRRIQILSPCQVLGTLHSK